MKYLIALLLFFAPMAQAQTPPPCYPMINGVHTEPPAYMIGEVGRHVFWFCSPRGGPSVVHGFSCLHGSCSKAALHAAHNTILQATAKVTTANNLWAQSMQFDCDLVKAEDTPRGKLCRERDAMLKVLEAGR